MADTSTNQPTVFDYATSTQWRLVFNRLPKTTWFCSAANIPGITLGEAMFPTSLSALEYSQDLTDVEYFKASATFRYLYYEFETSN